MGSTGRDRSLGRAARSGPRPTDGPSNARLHRPTAADARGGRREKRSSITPEVASYSRRRRPTTTIHSVSRWSTTVEIASEHGRVTEASRTTSGAAYYQRVRRTLHDLTPDNDKPTDEEIIEDTTRHFRTTTATI